MRRAAATLIVLDEKCACGCPLISCAECAGPRCLHCDPTCVAFPSCHDLDDGPVR